MSWVSPVKDDKALHEFEDGLKKAGEKYYVLFEIGLGTGLKLPDILDFRNRDVRGKERKISAGSLRSRRNCKERSFVIQKGRILKPGCFPGVPVPESTFQKNGLRG